VAISLQGADFAVEGSLDNLVTAVCLDELVWNGERAQNTLVICNPGRLAFGKTTTRTTGWFTSHDVWGTSGARAGGAEAANPHE